MKKWKITFTHRNFDFTKSCVSSYKDKDIFPEQHKSKLFSCLQTSQPHLLHRESRVCPPVFQCNRSPSAVLLSLIEGYGKGPTLKNNNTHFLLFKKKKTYVKSGMCCFNVSDNLGQALGLLLALSSSSICRSAWGHYQNEAGRRSL